MEFINYIESINNLENRLLSLNKTWSKIYVLVDENTKEHCLPFLFSEMDFFKEAEIIEIESGESSKSIEICCQIWQMLNENGADRKSLMVNLGGGVITDLGGFIASTFKRGIDFVNIPTTLLGQVDAAIGGKTGINLDNSKNQIGTFSQAIITIIDTVFLETLPEKEFTSGMGEVIKYGLILDKSIFETIKSIDSLQEKLPEIIKKCAKIKQEIVEKDFREIGERKKLNFGHTVGHAIESYFYGNLSHGEAIAIGMICESYISFLKTGLSEDKLEEIVSVMFNYFEKITFSKDDIPQIIDLMKSDKKNENGKLNFTLLSDIGQSKFDQFIEEELVIESLEFYLNMLK